MLPATDGFGTIEGLSACANPVAPKASRNSEKLFMSIHRDSSRLRDGGYFQESMASRGADPARKSRNSRRMPLGSVTFVMLVFVAPVRGSAIVTPRERSAATAAVRFSGQMPIWLSPTGRSGVEGAISMNVSLVI